MNKTFTAEQMLGYLQSALDDFMQTKERFGNDDDFVHYKMEMMIGAKEMVEAQEQKEEGEGANATGHDAELIQLPKNKSKESA